MLENIRIPFVKRFSHRSDCWYAYCLSACGINIVHLVAAASIQLPQSVGIELRQISKLSSKELDKSLFVGWTGLTASLNSERFAKPRSSVPRKDSGLWGSSALKSGLEFAESLELDEALASEMGWKENDRLSIKFHHRMSHATTVNVEPLTIDDWEILVSLNRTTHPQGHPLTSIFRSPTHNISKTISSSRSGSSSNRKSY